MRVSAAVVSLGLAFAPAPALRGAVPANAVAALPYAVYAPAAAAPVAPAASAALAVGAGFGLGLVAVLAVAGRPGQVRRHTHAARSAPLVASEGVAPPQAYIEFIIGVPEPCVPDVSLTRSRDGSSGMATFTFDNPTFLQASTEALGDTTGMYLKDSEGTMKSTDVTATFTNGKPRIVKGVVVMKGDEEWDRFMRFMERYAEANDLGFNKA